MAMIKVGTKVKVVIGIINTHFSIYPSNEAFLFILSGRFIDRTASALSYIMDLKHDGCKQTKSAQDALRHPTWGLGAEAAVDQTLIQTKFPMDVYHKR